MRSLVGVLAIAMLAVPAKGGVAPTERLVRAPSTATVVVERSPSGPGTVLPAAPGSLAVPRTRPVQILEIQGHMQAGDTDRALAAAERFVEENDWGRERDAAWMLIGMLEREQGHYNTASGAFTKVRAGGGPLALWGAFYEAEQDLARGKPWVAVKECEAVNERWPDGPHTDACLRVTARAWARLGRSASALDAAERYDEDHEDAPLTEQIELHLAEWEVDNDPPAAVRRLRKLSVLHNAPLTGRYAEELLDQLAASGVEGAEVPDDTASLKDRMISLRDTGRREEAWAVWEELEDRADDDPRLGAWLDGQAELFGWRTHNWTFLADRYRAAYEAGPTGDGAWDLYRVLGRAGRWDDACEVALAAQSTHGHTRHWRYSQEDVGRGMMLARRYPEAVVQYDAVAARGGWSGRRGKYLAAFAAWMAGEADDAVSRFDAIIDRNRSYITESRYWRASGLDALGRPAEAFADREWILENDPESWYALLIRQSEPLPEVRPFARDGRWPGAALPTFPEPLVPLAARADAPLPVAAQASPSAFEATEAYGRLTWPMRVGRPADRPPPPPVVLADLRAPPASYRASALFDPSDATADLYRFAGRYAAAWPGLPAIHDLASVGLYDLTGPLFAEFYEDWYDAVRRRYHRNHATAVGMHMQQDDWRPLFLTVRDHHHAARFTHGLDQDLEDPALKQEALRLAWPLAHDRFVWSHSREHDVDPYLVLALMRQESTYDANATSRAGARGAMQIMPRTGHLLADLAHDTEFNAGDLEDPVLAVGYGLTYLGLLMERFDGHYPLAVASYNGGPHNVAVWLRATGPDMGLDAFVEHIPFRETRGYVKRVSANYATYLSLYAPQGTGVVLPERPAGDDPMVVDF